jgi:hypothetical protein
MLLTTAAVAAGLVLGLVRGGRLSAVLRAPLRWWLLVPVGVGLQVGAERIPGGAQVGMELAGLVVLVAWAARNALHLPGAAIVGLGLGLNLAVVVANGHVPVRWEAMEAVGEATPEQRVPDEGLYRLETDRTRLAVLGDIVPVPVFDEVVSFGDLIMLAGVVTLTANLLLVPRRPGISPEELFLDDPIGPEVVHEHEPLDLRQPLPDWTEHPTPSRSGH